MKKPKRFNLTESTAKEKEEHWKAYKKMLQGCPKKPVLITKKEVDNNVEFNFEILKNDESNEKI